MNNKLDRLARLKTLFYSNLDNACATSLFNAFSKTFIVGFIQLLGGTDTLINTAVALPSLIGLLQIPGALWARSFSSYKPFVFWGQALWRFIHIPILFLTLLPLSNDTKLTLVLICIGLGAIGWHLSTVVIGEWLSDLVPPTSRGWFFGKRNAYAALMAATIGVIGGFALDAFKAYNQYNLGFFIVFSFILGISLLSLFSYKHMLDLPRPNFEKVPIKEGLKGLSLPLKDKNFRSVLIYSGILTSGLTFAGNLFYGFALQELHIPFAILQLTTITEAIGNSLFALFWGTLSNKYGNKPVLSMVGIGLFCSPIIWLFCFPGNDPWNAVILIVGYIFSGIVWGGAMLCQFNLILICSKPQQRANYLALALAVQALVGAIAPFLGGLLGDILKFKLACSNELTYKIVFVVSMILRLASVFALKYVHEPGALALDQTLKQLKGISPKAMRAMRKLSSSSDAEERTQALVNVASINLNLASEEVIKALYDPVPLVRKEAARTLKGLKDPQIALALMDFIQFHPNHVEPEMIESLGAFELPKSIKILAPYLESPRIDLQIAAINTISKLGNDTLPILLDIFKNSSEPLILTTYLKVFSELKLSPSKEIANLVMHPEKSVRESAAITLYNLKWNNYLGQLESSLEMYPIDINAEVCYAFSILGTEKHWIKAMEHGLKAQHLFTRHRCLLGIAHALNLEDEVYFLMNLEGINRESHMANLIKDYPNLRYSLDLFLAQKEKEALGELVKICPRESIFKLFYNMNYPDSYLIGFCLTLQRYN